MPTQISSWCPLDLTVEVMAPKRGLITERSPAELTTVVDQFDGQGRYAKRDVTGDGIDETFCNFFAREVLKALSIEIPRGRVNDVISFFESSKGWSLVPAWIAGELATRCGRPSVAIWKNPIAGRSGHIAIVVPGRNELDQETVFIAQAGVSNFVYGRLEAGFGMNVPVFYAHL